MSILNLTQYPATKEQIDAGVVDLAQGTGSFGEYVKQALTFEKLPNPDIFYKRAHALAAVALDNCYTTVMIGGDAFFMSTLERILLKKGIRPLYAFYCPETVKQDGSIAKIVVFKHLGFVDATASNRYEI